MTAVEAKLKLEWQSEEITRLRNWVADLQSGMFINCVYCGHRYGPNPGTPVSMAELLRAHIEVCKEHPASKLRAALVDAKEALKMIVDLANEGLIEEVGSPDHDGLAYAESALARVALVLQTEARRADSDTLQDRPDDSPTRSPAPGLTEEKH